MVKIDAIRSKKDAKWSKRTRYGQNRRKKVKKSTRKEQNSSQSQIRIPANKYHTHSRLIFILVVLLYFNQNNLKVPRARLFSFKKGFTINIQKRKVQK